MISRRGTEAQRFNFLCASARKQSYCPNDHKRGFLREPARSGGTDVATVPNNGHRLVAGITSKASDMWSSHGLKLRRWLVSVMVLIAGSLTSSILAAMNTSSHGTDQMQRIFELLSGLIVFQLSIHHLIWWHLCDLFQAQGSTVPLRKSPLSNYAAFLTVYGARMVAVAATASGLWSSNVQCGGVFVVLFQGCYGPPNSVVLSTSLLSATAYLLCLAKTASAIRSRWTQVG